MNLKFINDDEKILNIKLNSYESNRHIEEDTRNGNYFIQECYKFFLTDKQNLIEKFIKKSCDTHVYIIFSEDRQKRFYSPSIEFYKNYILVEYIKSYSF